MVILSLMVIRGSPIVVSLDNLGNAIGEFAGHNCKRRIVMV